MSKEKFEISKIQNPLDVMDINGIIGQVNDWKNQIKSDNKISEDENKEPLSKALVSKVATAVRLEFRKIGVEFPIEDQDLVLRYQATYRIPLNEDNYKDSLIELTEKIERLKKNPQDLESARKIFEILKDGKVDDKEQPIISGLKNSFVNLKFQSSPRVDFIGDFLDDPEYKDIANLHREEYKIGNKESESVKINLLDGSKQRTLFTDILAMGSLVGPLPKDDLQQAPTQIEGEAKASIDNKKPTETVQDGTNVSPSISKTPVSPTDKKIVAKNN